MVGYDFLNINKTRTERGIVLLITFSTVSDINYVLSKYIKNDHPLFYYEH